MEKGLAFTVAILLLFLYAPGPKHMEAAEHALQYLKDTQAVDLGVTYMSDFKDLDVQYLHIPMQILQVVSTLQSQ